MKQVNAVLLFGLLLVSSSVLMAEEGKKPWSWDTEAGYVETSGNSESTSATVNSKYKRTWEKFILTVKGAHVSASQDEHQSAESYSASEKGDLPISKRFYVYELLGWEKDRFAGIDHRYNGQAGLGYKILDRKKHHLDSELGADYTIEEYLNDTDDDFSSGRGYLKYLLDLSETSNFSQEVEVLRNLEDGDDYRVTSITALAASINTSLALKISYTVKFDNEPVTGFEKTDRILSTALILKL